MEASLSYSHVGGLFDYVLLVERDAVVDTLPAISAHEDQERLREVARFCAPRGHDGTVAITTRSKTTCWSFVLVRKANCDAASARQCLGPPLADLPLSADGRDRRPSIRHVLGILLAFCN